MAGMKKGGASGGKMEMVMKGGKKVPAFCGRWGW
jgi:hypothetical protein